MDKSKIFIFTLLLLLLGSCGSIRLNSSGDHLYTKEIPFTMLEEILDETGGTEEITRQMESSGFKMLTYRKALEEYDLDSDMIRELIEERKKVSRLGGRFSLFNELGGYALFNDSIQPNKTQYNVTNIHIGSINIDNSSTTNNNAYSKSDNSDKTEANKDKKSNASGEKESVKAEKIERDPLDTVYGIRVEYKYYIDLLYYSYKEFYAEIINLRTGEIVMTAYFDGDKRCKAVLKDLVNKLNYRFRE